MGVRSLVSLIEEAIVQLLAEYGIDAAPNPKAPGVYVGNEKIASLGLRVRRGCTYHGLSLNVDMDLEPFQRINPCGFAGLEVTSMARCLPMARLDLDETGLRLQTILADALG
jgi:lipoyl(octanoyl) transferase